MNDEDDEFDDDRYSQNSEQIRIALVFAAVPLEVIACQIKNKPYSEMTAELQKLILEAVDKIRALVMVGALNGHAG